MSNETSGDWVRIKSAEHLSGVHVQTTNFTTRRETPRHIHQEYAFGLAVKGAVEIDCGRCGTTHILKSGDLMLTEAHEVYAGRALGEPPWLNYIIRISKEKLVSQLDFATDGRGIAPPHYIEGAVRNNHLRRLFLNLHNALATEQLPLEQESLLLDWVVSVHRTYARQPSSFGNRKLHRETAAVRRVREFIADHSGENIKLHDLAEIARLSPFHLNRVFTAQVGLPPHAYQTQLRIERAGRLIAQKKSFSEVAIETGFSDQSHFNRFFKRYTGVTPSRFYAG